MNGTHAAPGEIERRSMEIIDQELTERGITLPHDQAHVVKRVIHTTADFDYGKSITFTSHAVERAVEKLRTGTAIVTDTNMTRAGINKTALQSLNCEVFCFMADPEVAEAARSREITRAAASMEYAARTHPFAIFAVGNAPTALFALAEEIEKGMRPSLVIGVPVGFVNVVEAKERILALCREKKIPAIVALGRKGGSNVSAAICNALLYTAAQLQDPEHRGW